MLPRWVNRVDEPQFGLEFYMSEDLHHECGVAALYWLGESRQAQPLSDRADTVENVTAFIPGMLMALQGRGQLAAGFSTYNPKRLRRIDTYKGTGTVSEVFHQSRPDQLQTILNTYAGPAAIGHTRYATSGGNDARCAQPFEHYHGRRWEWFSVAFNGTLANYTDLRDRLFADRGYHFSLDVDTEALMHALAYHLRESGEADLKQAMRSVAHEFDGAYGIAFLDAMGRMFVARDPLGLRPMNWAVHGGLFAAANESVALENMGFTDVHPLKPGEMAIIEDGHLRFERFAHSDAKARCFFEWVYFSNVASEIDGVGVYRSRTMAGQRLAEIEDQIVDEDCIVVPIPDTAKAAAYAFASGMNIPCIEGIIRNVHVNRTFIQPHDTRENSAQSKYTLLPAVLDGKRVFLIEDSIVRSTTLKALVRQMRDRGGVKELHVRVACPPIVSPCFYGIDISTLGELFATQFVSPPYDGCPPPEMLVDMAAALGVDSLRYLSVPELATAIGDQDDSLCLGCVTGTYTTAWGNRLMQHATQSDQSEYSGRLYEHVQL